MELGIGHQGASVCLMQRAAVGPGGGGVGERPLEVLISVMWVIPLDVLHSAHYGFCLRLPPGGAAHLHRALPVSGQASGHRCAIVIMSHNPSRSPGIVA